MLLCARVERDSFVLQIHSFTFLNTSVFEDNMKQVTSKYIGEGLENKRDL